jgi:DNA-binding CsgD family transcriptional regulator
VDVPDRERIARQIRAAFKAHRDAELQRQAEAVARFRAILEKYGRMTDVPDWGSMAYLKRIWRQTGRPVGELFAKTPRALVAYIEEHFRESKISLPLRAQSISPRPDASLYSLKDEKYRKRLLDEIKTISERTLLLLMPHRRGWKALLKKIRDERKSGRAQWEPPERRKEFNFTRDRDELVELLRAHNYRRVDVDHMGSIVVEVDVEALLSAGESENSKRRARRADRTAIVIPSKRITATSWPRDANVNPTYRVGDRVEHARFRSGVVVAGWHDRIDVEFMDRAVLLVDVAAAMLRKAARDLGRLFAENAEMPPNYGVGLSNFLPGWYAAPDLRAPQSRIRCTDRRYPPREPFYKWDAEESRGMPTKAASGDSRIANAEDLDGDNAEELDDENAGENTENLDGDNVEETATENAEELAAQELAAQELAGTEELAANKQDAEELELDAEQSAAENTEELDAASTRSDADNYSQPPTTSPLDPLFGRELDDGDSVGSGVVEGRQIDQAPSIDRPDHIAPYIAIAHQTGERKAFISQRDAQEWLCSTAGGGDLWRWDYRYRDDKSRRPLTEYELARRALPRKDALNVRENRRELLTRIWGPKWPVVRLSPPDGKPDVSLAAALERVLSDPAQASKADRAILGVIESRAWEFARKFAFARYAYQDRRSDYEHLRAECIRIALANKQDFPVGHPFLPGALYKLIGERLRDSYHDQFRDVFAKAKGLPRIEDDAETAETDADAVIEDAPDEYFHRNGASTSQPFDAQPFDLGLLDFRQRKILDLKLVRDLTNEEIAAKLGVNERTVRRDIDSAKGLWRAARVGQSEDEAEGMNEWTDGHTGRWRSAPERATRVTAVLRMGVLDEQELLIWKMLAEETSPGALRSQVEVADRLGISHDVVYHTKAKIKKLLRAASPPASSNIPRIRCYCGCAGPFDRNEPGFFDRVTLDAHRKRPSRCEVRNGRGTLGKLAHTLNCLMGGGGAGCSQQRISELGLEFIDVGYYRGEVRVTCSGIWELHPKAAGS